MGGTAKSHREANQRWYKKHKQEHIRRTNRRRAERRKAAKKTDSQMDAEALRWLEESL